MKKPTYEKFIEDKTQKELLDKEYQELLESERISAADFYRENFGDLPKPSVYLAGLRYRENLTQKELADLVGSKQGNISQIERGKREIGLPLAKKLGKVFKVDYRDFI